MTPASSDSFAFTAHHASFKRHNHVIVSGLSLSVPRGSLVALVGPNGSGKSTLLDAIAQSQAPCEGAFHLSPHEQCVYLPQLCRMKRDFPLLVRDVVGSGLWPQLPFWHGLRPPHHQAIMQALEAVGLTAYALTPIMNLSGGQFQRVLFARMMVQQGTLLLLDEPFTGVDEATISVLLALIQQWHKQGHTLIVAMHNLEHVKKLFPHTLLLARSFSQWGPTATTLTEANLAKAYQKSHEWSFCPC
ncbi:metal ABC transporter ATP-binding protein [Candidatus Hepatobacter penaei]|uniref:metal ABC transporter ATP-binding protein n=1 Tax=Candidatus Hepatobacter penaei TaxID=1274402 RepID=UPI000697F55C|nr:ABC transporter ATP-binding protein [Candidatus Hepatobacter penaei]